MPAILLVLFILLPLGAMILAVSVDGRTRLGYGLGVFSFLLLACNVLVVSAFVAFNTSQPPAGRRGSSLGLLFSYFGAIYVTLFVVGGAIIEAGRAHHWQWIIGFLAALVVPVLLIATTALPLPFWKGLNTANYVQSIGYVGALVAPVTTVLVYSIRRIVRPKALALARHPTIAK
jgi:hypothetical protein